MSDKLIEQTVALMNGSDAEKPKQIVESVEPDKSDESLEDAVKQILTK